MTQTTELFDELEIIYRDEYLIAINKPAGLLVHRTALDYHDPHNAQDWLQNQIGSKPLPLHRLDKPTSGVLLFALDKQTAANISEQFQNHLLTKHYIAVVRGHTQENGNINHPVRDRDSRQKLKKEATTRYTTLGQIEIPIAVDKYSSTRYSVVEVQPLSGRRHQIRLHMKHISHPIIGDTSYGKSVHNKFFKSHLDCSRLLLHAHHLVLLHPNTNKQITLTAHRYDTQFKRVLSYNGWIWNKNEALTSINKCSLGL